MENKATIYVLRKKKKKTIKEYEIWESINTWGKPQIILRKNTFKETAMYWNKISKEQKNVALIERLRVDENEEIMRRVIFVVGYISVRKIDCVKKYKRAIRDSRPPKRNIQALVN